MYVGFVADERRSAAVSLVPDVAERARDGELAVDASVRDEAARRADARDLVGPVRAHVHREVHGNEPLARAPREHAPAVAQIGDLTHVSVFL